MGNIGAWLNGLGLGRSAAAFAENDIDGEMLATLTADDLKELGVASLGHRKKLLQAIGDLATPTPAPQFGAPAGHTPAYLAERIRGGRGALEGVLKDRRRDLHVRAGDAIANLYAERWRENFQVIVTHHERAEDWARAAQWRMGPPIEV